MNDSLLLSMATIIYGISALFYVLALIFKKSSIISFARNLSILGITFLTLGILLRWFKSYQMGIGHVPLSNLYESLVFFSWVVVLFNIIIEKKYNNLYIGILILPLAFFAIVYASFSPNVNTDIQPLVPALKSNWLFIHVVTCFFGYAAFSISFGLSIIYLIKRRLSIGISVKLDFLPEIYVLEQLNYQMVILGLLFLSIGIITGSLWANSAWGSYWSWDPKETWSLITWFIYSILLHVRLVRNWDGKKIAYISMLGFLAVLFTYFGINYLHGLHSYIKV